MTLKEQILFGAIVVVVAIAAMFGIQKLIAGSPSFGAVGNLLAEHYIPYVSTNQGYSSALPIVTTSTLGAGNTTVTGTLGVSATTTLSYPVNLNNSDLCVNFYATSTATQLHMVASSTSLVNGVSTGVMLLSYGACAL